MRVSKVFCTLLWLSSAIELLTAQTTSTSTSANQLSPIEIRNGQLVNSQTGAKFNVGGAGYDYYVDNASKAKWQKAFDLLLASAPTINTVRFYVVDPTLQYDEFMNYMASKGIYVIVPLTPTQSCALNRDGLPALNDNSCYPSCLLEFGEKVINLFSQYTNVLAYTVGNEVINNDKRWAAAPCVKAYAADLKHYQRSCGLRYVPLIYSAADNDFQSAGLSAEQNDRAKVDYLTCGPEDLSIDLYGLNFFRWCNNECTFSTCQYDLITQSIQGTAVPTIFSEIGCENYHYDPLGANTKGQREWKELPVVLGPQMNSVFNGAIGYTYGVRGGIGFSFFDDGDSDPQGNPGYTKYCGPGPNGANVCNVDLFGQQMANALQGAGSATRGSTTSNSTATAANKLTSTDSTSSTTSSSSTSNGSRPKCPTFNGVTVDLSVPFTRQGAEGFNTVQCPNGQTPTARGPVARTVPVGGDNSPYSEPADQAMPSTTPTTSTGGSTTGTQTSQGITGTQGGSTTGSSNTGSGVSPNAQTQHSSAVIIGTSILTIVTVSVTIISQFSF